MSALLNKKNILVLFFATLFGFMIPSFHFYADTFKSPIQIKLVMDKKVFDIGEPVDGKVVIENDYPSFLPATFIVRLYQDGQLINEHLTAVEKIYQGTTEIPFKSFGIPDFLNEESVEGRWRITILQRNVDENYGAEASFVIRNQDSL